MQSGAAEINFFFSSVKYCFFFYAYYDRRLRSPNTSAAYRLAMCLLSQIDNKRDSHGKTHIHIYLSDRDEFRSFWRSTFPASTYAVKVSRESYSPRTHPVISRIDALVCNDVRMYAHIICGYRVALCRIIVHRNWYSDCRSLITYSP